MRWVSSVVQSCIDTKVVILSERHDPGVGREKISKTKDLVHNNVSIELLVELTKVFLLTNLGFFG